MKFGMIANVDDLVVRRRCSICHQLYRMDEHYASLAKCPSCNIKRSNEKWLV